MQQAGIQVILEKFNIGNYTYLDCILEEAKKPEEEMMLRHYVANAISDAILNHWEYKILKKITRLQYYYLSPQERENVLLKAKKILEDATNYGGDHYLMYRMNRKSKILHKLLDYLSQNNNINIDGFINFRLQDYLAELNQVIEEAVDELLVEKEHQEFIMLLKYFVDIQEPRMEKVHVIMLDPGNIQLLNENFEPLNNEQLEGCLIEMIGNNINYEDLLISALITIAPKEIVLHLPTSTDGDKNIIKVLQGVFMEKLVLCNGCIKCSPRH